MLRERLPRLRRNMDVPFSPPPMIPNLKVTAGARQSGHPL